MPRFTSAPVDDVTPRQKTRQASGRALIQAQYQQALKEAVLDGHEALVVELEDGDMPLTIRNRLIRAAERLGLEHVKIRRRGQRIFAYREQEIPRVGSDDALGG